MAVYVDELFCTEAMQSKRWRYSAACHMWADTLEELHAMAGKLGLKMSWFQNHERLPHYDLTINKRALALRLGAVKMSLRDHYRKARPSNAKEARSEEARSEHQ